MNGIRYFIIDAAGEINEVSLYKTQQGWLVELEAFGLPTDIVLQSPDVLALAMPDRVIRPYAYHVMHGRLGLSDEEWASVVQLFACVVALVVGFFTQRGSLWPIAIGLGLAIVAIGDIILVGGGPTVCPGMVVYPIACWLFAYLGRSCRKLIRKLKNRPTSPSLQNPQ